MNFLNLMLHFVPVSVYVDCLCGQHSCVIYVKWVKAHVLQGKPYKQIWDGSWSLAEEEKHYQVYFKMGVISVEVLNCKEKNQHS